MSPRDISFRITYLTFERRFFFELPDGSSAIPIEASEPFVSLWVSWTTRCLMLAMLRDRMAKE